MDRQEDNNTVGQIEAIGKLLDCNNRWGDVIHDLKIKVGDAHYRLDALDSAFTEQKKSTLENKVALDRVERRLEKAESQREKFSDKMTFEVKDLKETVSRLSDSDNERHIELVTHLSNLSEHVDHLAEATAENANYISEAEAKERQEKYAQEKVDEALAPKKKIKNQIIMTTVGLVTAFTVGVLGKLAWMAINLDELVTQVKKVEMMEHKVKK